jgi:hypothetical protein
VRFVNGSYGLPAAAFDATDDGDAESATLAPFADSGAEGVAVSRAAGRQLALRSASARLTGFTLPARTILRGRDLFVIAAGLPTFVPREPRGLALIVVDATGATLIKQNPALYLLHTVPDAGALDLYAFVDPTVSRQAPRAAASLAYGQLTAPVQVPPSDASGFGAELVVTEAGAGTDSGIGAIVAAHYEQTLAAGERYLVIASGFQAPSYAGGPRPPISLTAYRDGFTTALTGKGLVRVIHGSGDAPGLDVGRTPPGLDTFTALAATTLGLTWEKSSPEAGEGVPNVPLNPAVQATGTSAPARFKYSAIPSTDRAFGVVAGSWAPGSPDEHGLGFIVVKATNAGTWTATLLSPSGN